MAWWHVLVALACFAGTSAATDDVYAVHFNHPLTRAFVARLSTTLGYACTEPVADNGLVLFLNASAHAYLDVMYRPWLVSMTPMSPASRLATTLTHYGLADEFNGDHFSRATLAHMDSPDTNMDVAAMPTAALMRLQFMLHGGALASASADYWFAHVRAAVALFDAALVTTSVDATLVTVDAVPRLSAVSLSLHVMAHVPCVCYVAPVYEPQLVNLWSSSTIQVPGAISATSITGADSCPTSTCHPLWAAGLRGDGQLIAISDTGVAASTCFFVDTTHAVPTSTTFGNVPVDTGHRTIRVLSSGVGGNLVDNDVHGTHTCGIALGRPTVGTVDSPTALDAPDFTGSAPGARLVMIDLQASAGGGLAVPSPYDTQLLAYAYATGARIHSGSWGIADFAYSLEDRQVDLFCWTHRTFVAIFAAGNAGVSRGAASILSPALAKNAIAVGAAMNGYSSVAVASGSAPGYSADAYAYDWLADFSSRGGAALPVSWRKPDVVAAGGTYVWSAASTGSASCAAPISSNVVGLAGTSEAAPSVSGAVAIIRQYFMQGFYYNAPVEPVSALVRALLAASATPTRGVFPQQAMSLFAASNAYAPYGAGYLEGAGRVSIARALPLSSLDGTLVVLSNEGAALTATGAVHRYCVALAGITTSADVVVVLAYTDYPSTLNAAGTGTLVNDLDVRVYVDGATTVAAHPNGLASRDAGSPLEVVRATTTTGRLRIEVHAATIAFEVQTYALALVSVAPTLEARVNGVVVDGLVDVSATTPDGTCVVCGGTTYVAECSTCGNGVVDGAEVCDVADAATPCCADTCMSVLSDARACNYTLVEAACVLPGTCSVDAHGACVVDMLGAGNVMYVLNASTGLCTTVPTPTPSPATPAPTTAPAPPSGVCAHSVDGALRALVHATDADVVCCRTHAAIAAEYVAGATSHDVVFAQLTRQLVAATANARRGVVTSAMTLMAMTEAAALLHAHCADGFAAATPRRSAHTLVSVLAAFNAGTCSGDAPETPTVPCTGTDQTRANAEYCNGHGTYDAANDECRCASGFHPEPACRARHCWGHGASSADGATCTCLPGWTGVECLTCASAPATGLMYLCLGLDRARVPAALDAVGGPHAHALALVDSTTVSARLSGAFYASGQVRAPDARPGTGEYDCACQTLATAIDYTRYASHAAALNDAAAALARRDALLTLAAPRAAITTMAVPMPPPPPPSNDAARQYLHVMPFASALVAAGIACIAQ